MELVTSDSGMSTWMYVILGGLIFLAIFVGIIIYRSFRKKKY